ncbi:unnamed protein product [Dovyalis caffra]|uniref:Auxin-responsive protein n=1 Tax=Dovyalis caffra TaxID=77055 RepID=A0AAV1RZN1_9ROSI|nr:unnamed protein product [Dovyalis caffra]
MAAAEPDKYSMINFEETELRLGLPGGIGNGNDGEVAKSIHGKRGFSETVDLKLNLSTKESRKGRDEEKVMKEKTVASPPTDLAKPPAKAQVVGWPPVRSFRKNVMAVQKNSNDDGEKSSSSGAAATFVKVSMDGAPYLRKVDLKLYKSYQELSDALGKMFSSFTIGNCSSQGMKDFMNESKLIDLLNDSEYVPSYEDRDGDWMLVGDVPWDMFVDSCKRLRIMKGSEAVGLGYPKSCGEVQEQKLKCFFNQLIWSADSNCPQRKENRLKREAKYMIREQSDKDEEQGHVLAVGGFQAIHYLLLAYPSHFGPLEAAESQIVQSEDGKESVELYLL